MRTQKSAATRAAIALNEARTRKLSAAHRSEVARKAALARWSRQREANAVPKISEGDEKNS